jgi:hypothetical protein
MVKSVGEVLPVAIETRLIRGNTEPALTMKTALNTTGHGILMRTPGTTPVLAWLQESTMSILKTTRVVL